MINTYKHLAIIPTMAIIMLAGVASCSTDNTDDAVIDDSVTDTDDESSDDDEIVTELHAAFAEFNTDATTIYLDGSNVVIETTGLPNHETVYWGEGNELYIEEDGVATTPSIMSSNNNATTITVDATPDLTGNTVATQLNTIGIAVSGASIFNDQEGNGALDQAAASLDWTGAHIGPGVYHYHLEPKAFTNDDDNLVGILLDGVFLYGRRDYPSDEYPTDLDGSGGHFGPTPHNPDGEYHYHIINEVYSTTGSYLAFAGPYQGY
ncbi:YHYH protein [Aurantibacter sp.]|uniref:YHYH protein n=1 Tax=Aurantibacter sp. TaxID=2807103 RepID=UPI0032658D2C